MMWKSYPFKNVNEKYQVVTDWKNWCVSLPVSDNMSTSGSNPIPTVLPLAEDQGTNPGKQVPARSSHNNKGTEDV